MKTHMKIEALLGACVILAMFIVPTKRPNNVDYASVFSVTPVDIQDIIPSFNSIAIQNIKGKKITHLSGDSTYYFEYEADREKIFQTLSTLPFSIHYDRSDVQCGLVERPINLQESITNLSSDEYNASHFFWDINPQEFAFFQCMKQPMIHTIAIHKHSKRIVHRIEEQS